MGVGWRSMITFTDGLLNLGPDNVSALLKGDGNVKKQDASDADIAVVHHQEDKEGDLSNWHSARKDGDNTFTQKDDIDKIKTHQTVDQVRNYNKVAKDNPDLTISYFKKALPDRRINTDAGNVSGGLRTVSKQELKGILGQ